MGAWEHPDAGMHPAFPMRLCTRCAHAPGHAAFDNTSSIVEKSRALLRGFVRNASMPAAAHRSRSSDMACAVTAITGVRCPDTLSSSVGVAQEGGPRAHDVVRDDADPGDEECGGRGQRRQGPHLRADGQIAEHEHYLTRKIANLLELEPGYLSTAKARAAGQS